MLRFPGRKKKSKEEKKAETPTRIKEDVSLKAKPAEGRMPSSTVLSVHVKDVTKSHDKVKKPSDLAIAGQGQSELETSLCVPKRIKHVPIPQSNLSDRGYSSMSTLGESGLVQFRRYTLSSISSGSFHTPSSGASPNISGHVSSKFAVSGHDDVLKNILEKLTQLDKKIESHHESLTARVGDLEEKMKCLWQQTGTEGTNTTAMSSNTLPDHDLIEVCMYMYMYI